MLHLVTAWKTKERKGNPEVLYCGLDRSVALKAANQAPGKYLRVEYADVLLSLVVRRPAPAPVSQNSTVTESPKSPIWEPAPSAPTEAVAAGGPSDDGPQLIPSVSVDDQKPEIRNQKPSRR